MIRKKGQFQSRFMCNNATTTLGQSVYITGNKPELGNWSIGDAAGPASCPTYPDWSVSVNLPVGEKIDLKLLNMMELQ